MAKITAFAVFTILFFAIFICCDDVDINAETRTVTIERPASIHQGTGSTVQLPSNHIVELPIVELPIVKLPIVDDPIVKLPIVDDPIVELPIFVNVYY
jgi:hypothetical protein